MITIDLLDGLGLSGLFPASNEEGRAYVTVSEPQQVNWSRNSFLAFFAFISEALEVTMSFHRLLLFPESNSRSALFKPTLVLWNGTTGRCMPSAVSSPFLSSLLSRYSHSDHHVFPPLKGLHRDDCFVAYSPAATSHW